MITINETTLSELGIELGDTTPELLNLIKAQLNERTGIAIIELLDEDQAAELMTLNEVGNAKEVQTWLATNLPQYKEVIQDEFDILMAEVANNVEKLQL